MRTVQGELGGLLTIDDDPAPDGDLIPWPSPAPYGVAQARRVTVPVTDGPMWREHSCPYP